MAIIRWFIEYSGDDKKKYQEFIERKLDNIIAAFLKITADKSYAGKYDELKKMKFADFEKLVEKVNSQKTNISTNISKAKYNIVPIYSYQTLHKKYGGDKTGYNGQSEWCHTNGKSTYESWTKNGTQMFFVIERDNWEKIQPPEPKTLDTAYDEYGLSLIAILVEVKTGKLLNSALRWNHVITPSTGAVDKAFDDWEQLNKVVGFDIKKQISVSIETLAKKQNQLSKNADKYVATLLLNKTTITDSTIPEKYKNHITNVVIPDSVTSIEYGAFARCSSLRSVTISNSVTSIGKRAFQGCSSLRSVTISNSVTSIGDWAFQGCSSLTSVKIPNSVTNIGYEAFGDCASLTNVTIPNSVTSLGNWAFRRCASLTSVTIGKGITSIGGYAFADCTSLTSVTMPDSVTSIGNSAFSGCSGLKSAMIPDSVTSMGDRAFFYCEGLTSITIPDSVTSIGDGAFAGCTSLTSVTIPDSVEIIGDYAFSNCSGLTNITIPDSVTSIGYAAFSDCNRLTSMTIPDSVMNIGENTFWNCNRLTSIIIGKGVTSIGWGTFYNCDQLKHIVFKGKTLDEIKNMRSYPWSIKNPSIITMD